MDDQLEYVSIRIVAVNSIKVMIQIIFRRQQRFGVHFTGSNRIHSALKFTDLTQAGQIRQFLVPKFIEWKAQRGLSPR